MPVVAEQPEPKKASMWGWAAILGLALIVLAVLFLRPYPAGDGEAIDSLAVLPFENTRNDPQVDYLSDGIPESLIDRLSELPQLRVMARSTAFRYRDAGMDPQTVGRELGVGAVLTGRVVQRDDTLNVHAELVDVESGSQLWGESYDREMADIVSVQNDIAQEISQALRLQISGEEQQQLATSRTANSEAYQAYLKGRFFWNKRTNEDFKRAIVFFEEAREKDPEYALAYVGLADCYSLLGLQVYGRAEEFAPSDAFTNARRAALEALRLDPSLAEARATLAWVRFLYDWDWEGAEEEFKKAIALDPNYATAHQWYSVYLYSMERNDEAIQAAKHALEIDPISPLLNRSLGSAFQQAGRYQEAIEQFEKTLELDPSFPLARQSLAHAYWLNGMKDKAISEAGKANEELGRYYQLVQANDRAEAIRILATLSDDAQILHVGRYYIAGDEDTVFERLERAFEQHDPQLVMALVSSELEPLRSSPRYQNLLQRMNLPQ
jgi:TolB-like protein